MNHKWRQRWCHNILLNVTNYFFLLLLFLFCLVFFFFSYWVKITDHLHLHLVLANPELRVLKNGVWYHIHIMFNFVMLNRWQKNRLKSLMQYAMKINLKYFHVGDEKKFWQWSNKQSISYVFWKKHLLVKHCYCSFCCKHFFKEI